MWAAYHRSGLRMTDGVNPAWGKVKIQCQEGETVQDCVSFRLLCTGKGGLAVGWDKPGDPLTLRAVGEPTGRATDTQSSPITRINAPASD